MSMMVAMMALAALQDHAGAATSPTPEKKVCRSEQTLGSFLPKRVCRTAVEWAAIDAGNASAAESALARRRTGVPGRN